MRRAIAASAIAIFFLLGSVVTSASLSVNDVEARDAKTIAATPIHERNGKNVALTLEVYPDSPKKLPLGVSILVNDRQVNLYDNGRWPDELAGDGVYTTAGKTTDGKPLEKKTSAPIRFGQKSNHVVSPIPSIGCTFEAVECPKDCKSLIFGSKCVVCFKLKECSISLFD